MLGRAVGGKRLEALRFPGALVQLSHSEFLGYLSVFLKPGGVSRQTDNEACSGWCLLRSEEIHNGP